MAVIYQKKLCLSTLIFDFNFRILHSKIQQMNFAVFAKLQAEKFTKTNIRKGFENLGFVFIRVSEIYRRRCYGNINEFFVRIVAQAVDIAFGKSRDIPRLKIFFLVVCEQKNFFAFDGVPYLLRHFVRVARLNGGRLKMNFRNRNALAFRIFGIEDLPRNSARIGKIFYIFFFDKFHCVSCKIFCAILAHLFDALVKKII